MNHWILSLFLCLIDLWVPTRNPERPARHRDNLSKACGQEIQHMEKALNCMNIHLHHAVSDLHGETGLRILNAILAGQRDPKELVLLRDPQIARSTVAEMEAALSGDWREEELFVLRQALDNYRHLAKTDGQLRGRSPKALAKVMVNPATVEETDRPQNPPAASPNGRNSEFSRREPG